MNNHPCLMVPDQKYQFQEIDLVESYASDQRRCRLHIQFLVQECPGVRAEIIIEYLPGIQEIRDDQLVPHVFLKSAEPDSKTFHILIAVLQEPVDQLDEGSVGRCGKNGIHGDMWMAELQITSCASPGFGRIKTLIREREECITMKREDEDWKIYHLIPPASPITVNDLAEKSGLALPVVEDSLARLESACLVERKGMEVRMLNFGEALIRNQLKYDEELPYTIENGVIKARK
jgi:hypothetical protein